MKCREKLAVCLFLAIFFYGVGQKSVLAGSILEGSGLTANGNYYINNQDSSAVVGNKVTLTDNGLIDADDGEQIHYIITDGYTLDVGDKTLTLTSSVTTTPGEACLDINSGGNLTINTSGKIVATGPEAYLGNRGTVTNKGNIESNGLVANLGGGVFNNDGIIHIVTGGLMSNNNGGELNNSGTIKIDGALWGRTNSSLINKGTIQFGSGALYGKSATGDVIDNTLGAIQIGLTNTDLSDLLSDIKFSNAGVIEFTSGDVAGTGFTNTNFSAGQFKFNDAQTQTVGGDINVGNASVRFAGGGTFAAGVKAKTVTTSATSNTTTFSGAVDGNLVVETVGAANAVTLDTSAVYTGTSLTIGTSTHSGTYAILNNNSTSIVDVSAGQFNNYGIFNNTGNMKIGNYNHLSSGDSRINHSAGNLELVSGKTGFANAFADTVLTGGTVTITGSGYSGNDLALNTSSTNAGTVIVAATAGSTLGGGTTAINTGAAKLQIDTRTVFNGSVTTTHTADVVVKDGAVFKNGVVTASAIDNQVPTTANNSLRFEDTATFAGASVKNAGIMEAVVSNINAASVNAGLFNKTTLTGGNAALKVIANGDVTVAGGLALAAAANTAQNVELASSGGTLNFGGNIDVKSANLKVSSGTAGVTAVAATITANSFSIGSDGVFAYDSGGSTGTLTVTAATGSRIESDGALHVAGGDTVAFGAVAFANGSAITLDAGANVTATTFDFSALSAKGLTLTLNGDKSDWISKLLFGNVTDNSVFHTGRYQTAVNAGQLEITGYFTSAADLLGPLLISDMSVNIANGFTLLDVIDADATVSQTLKDALNDDTAELEGWLSSPASYKRGLRAQRQRQGEYGNASRETLSTTTALFSNRLLRRFDANVDLNFGLNAFTAAASAQSGDAYASLSGTAVRSRNGGYDYCPPAATIWADFHSGWAQQKAKSNINGYDYDGYGVTMGAERRIDRFLVGVAGGYTRAKVDVDDLATEYKADVMNLGVYAGYIHESGFFARAAIGFAHAWNDYDVSMAMGPNKKGDFKSHSYTANLDLGYVVSTPVVNIIPSVGLHYTHTRQNGWRESGGRQGTAGFFEKERYNSVDVPVALRVNKVFETGCVKIAPEVRAAWVYAAKKNRSEINYGLQGAGHTATMYGVNPGRSRFQVGAGVKAQWAEKYEAGLDYDYEFRSKYHSHNLSVNLGISF